MNTNIIKKLLCIVMAITVLFSLTSCGKDVPDDIEVVHEENEYDDGGYAASGDEDGTGSLNLVSNITGAGSFKNGYAWITYSAGSRKEALIDKKGRIIYSVERGHGISSEFIGEKTASYYDHNSLCSYVLDFNGKILTSSENGDYDVILSNKNDEYFVYKHQTGIEGAKELFGIIDKNGNFTMPFVECDLIDGLLWNKESIGAPSSKYLGEGWFEITRYGSDFKLLFNEKTGKFFGIKFESLSHISYSVINGKIYYNKSGVITYENGTEVNTNGCFAIDSDGTFEALPDFDGIRANKLINNDREAKLLTITDPITGETGYFSKYSVYGSKESDECIAVICVGGDRNLYVTVLDNNGEMRFEPIRVMRDCTVGEGLLLYTDPDSEKVMIIDYDGNTVLSDIECEGYGSFSEGLCPFEFKDTSKYTIAGYESYYKYMDKNGNFVLG